MITITNILIGFTVLVSISAFSNRNIFDGLKFNAYAIIHGKQWWRVLSNVLVHANFVHLFMNMYVMYMFGNIVEDYLEYHFPTSFLHIIIFLGLYTGGAVFSEIYALEKHRNNPAFNSIGASGAVSGLVFAYIAIDPSASLYLLFLPVPIPGMVLGFLYLIYSWYMSRRKIDNIDHEAHFFGAIFGLAFMFIVTPPLFKQFIQTIVYYFQSWTS